MTVSSSTDFNPTAVSVITNARRLLGISAEEESLEANELTIGLDWLTMILKDMEADPDLGTWLETQGTLTLVASDKDYTFQAAGDFTTVPFEISHMRVVKSSGNYIEMRRISRQEYYRLPNPTSTGFPTQWFYDRQRDGGVLYVWPVPDASDYSVAFTYRRRIMDTDAGTDNLDIPPEWIWAVTHRLAVALGPLYGRAGTPEFSRISDEADNAMGKLKMFDAGNDNGSVTIEADYYSYRR
jgi:hypothetical protein